MRRGWKKHLLTRDFTQYAQPVTKKGAKKDAPAEGTEEKKLSHHAQRNLDEKKKGEWNEPTLLG